jgi:hypothetical protein
MLKAQGGTDGLILMINTKGNVEKGRQPALKLRLTGQQIQVQSLKANV